MCIYVCVYVYIYIYIGIYIYIYIYLSIYIYTSCLCIIRIPTLGEREGHSLLKRLLDMLNVVCVCVCVCESESESLDLRCTSLEPAADIQLAQTEHAT